MGWSTRHHQLRFVSPRPAGAREHTSLRQAAALILLRFGVRERVDWWGGGAGGRGGRGMEGGVCISFEELCSRWRACHGSGVGWLEGGTGRMWYWRVEHGLFLSIDSGSLLREWENASTS